MNLSQAILDATHKVTKKWEKQAVREIRDHNARVRRRQVFCQKNRLTKADVVRQELPDVYDTVSGGGKSPASARQLYYRMRPLVKAETDSNLEYGQFSQDLLPEYMRNNHQTKHWQVYYDPRGSFTEPHTGRQVPLGTLEVDGYLREIAEHKSPRAGAKTLSFVLEFPTCGMANRCSGIIYVEKQGFFPLLRHAKIAERHDVSYMSTKGESNVSSRHLADELCKFMMANPGVPLFILHDLDVHGFSILRNMVTSGKRYQFRHPIIWHDWGLRLDDVNEWSLAEEPAGLRKKDQKKLDNLRDVEVDGRFLMTDEEYELLSGHKRVELNAFTSPDFIAWVEGKLKEHGVKKVVPDAEALDSAYRWMYERELANEMLAKEAKEMAKKAGTVALPKGLGRMIRKAIKANPMQPWDEALAGIVKKQVKRGQ